MKRISNLIRVPGILLLLTTCNYTTSKQNPGDTNVVSSVNDAGESWERLGPGGGGSTFIPTFSYHSVDKFLIKCDMTGSYLTDDGGLSYSIINNPNGSGSFAFDPQNEDIIYLGTNGLNKSNDGGSTWHKLFPDEQDIMDEVYSGDHAGFKIIVDEASSIGDFDHQTVRNIKVDPNNSDYIFFSIDRNFYYTIDGGDNWSVIQLDQPVEFIYTDTGDLKTEVFLFSPQGLIVVNKKNWDRSMSPYPTEMNGSFSFTGGSIKATGNTVFYALQNELESKTSGVKVPTTIWKSVNLGKHWEKVKDPIITNPQGNVPTFSKLSAAENNAAKVYVVTSDYEEKVEDGTIAHWYGTIKSTDAGNSWQWVWKGGGGSGQYAVKDGQDATNLKDAWVNEAFGGEYIRLIDVGVAPDDGDVAIVTDWYRTMKTMDGGKTWVQIYSDPQPDGSYTSRGLDVTTAYGVHFDPFDKNHIAISYTDIGFHHSFNGGKSWTRSTTGIPPPWHNTCYWMVFDPKVKNKIWSVWSGLHDFPRGKMTRNPKWTAYGRGGVAVSIDGGKTWQPTVEGMGFDTPSTSIVLDENSPVGSRTLYVAAYGKGVYKSTNDGKTWQLRNNGISESLAAFELSLIPDGTLFLITSPTPQHRNGQEGREVFMGAVYKSTDGADTWVKLDVGEKVKFPNGLAFDPNDPDRIYLGAWADIQISDLIGGALANKTGGNDLIDLDGGIFLSEDQGETWQQIFNPEHYVYDVTVDPANPGRLYCNTFDQGAYQSNDYGISWNKIKDYDFHWGQRVIVDKHHTEKIFLVTYGSSVWYGTPKLELTKESL